jgi:hypothetical protein
MPHLRCVALPHLYYPEEDPMLAFYRTRNRLQNRCWDYDNATKCFGVSSPSFHESNVEEKAQMPNIEVIPGLKLVVQNHIGNFYFVDSCFLPSFGAILVFNMFWYIPEGPQVNR